MHTLTERTIKAREGLVFLFDCHRHMHMQTPPSPQRETLSRGDGSCKWHFVYIMRMWKIFFRMDEALIKWDCLYLQLNIFHLWRWECEAEESKYVCLSEPLSLFLVFEMKEYLKRGYYVFSRQIVTFFLSQSSNCYLPFLWKCFIHHKTT